MEGLLMASLEVGEKGATSLAWANVNPRETLLRIRADNHAADREELLELFAAEIRNDAQMIDALILYWFKNNYDSLTRERRKPADPVPSRVVVEKVKAEIRENATKLVLLDLVLPHGKTLADSTGGECSLLGPRVGKWLEKIGEAVPSGKLVGKTLTEENVRQLYASV
jgi:hypothetical protein